MTVTKPVPMAFTLKSFLNICSLLVFVNTLFTVLPSHAFQMNLDPLSITFDTTLSYGGAWRIQERDPQLVEGDAINDDDGNLNYQTGLISHLVKGTHELELRYSYFGAFARATYFYDFYNNNKDELAKASRDIVGRDFDLLDAYVSGKFQSVALRVGYQVVNWGEGLFHQNGINAANAYDLTKLELPGAELREAVIPSPIVWASIGIITDLSLEGFYIAEFEKHKLQATGSYFSTTDVFGQGAIQPLFIDTGTPPFGVISLARADDVDARNGGEYGVSLRYFASYLNNTEFGFYFMNYHHRAPVIGANGGSALALLGIPGLTPPGVFAEYPEDVQLFGFSFNTDVLGLGVSGEFSCRPENPFQLNVEHLITTCLMESLSGATGQVFSGVTYLPVGQYALVLIKDFASANPFWADNMRLMAEVAGTHLYEMPAENETPLQAQGENVDEFSLGYQVVLTMDYFKVIGPVALYPQIAFAHHVSGSSPAGGNFIEGQMSLTLGVTASYLQTLTLDVGYSTFWGAEDKGNTTHDRDFVSATLKYFL